VVPVSKIPASSASGSYIILSRPDNNSGGPDALPAAFSVSQVARLMV
jgi:hypothetical protein